MRHYREWDYDRGVVTEYERSGECVQCGACCRAHIQFGAMKPYRSRNAKNGGPWTDERDVWQELDLGRWNYFFRIHTIEPDKAEVCGSLQEDGLCKWHDDPDRPLICREWPITPSNIALFPECGWSFRELSQRPIEKAELQWALA